MGEETVGKDEYELKCLEMEELQLEFDEFKEISTMYEKEMEDQIEGLKKKYDDQRDSYDNLKERLDKKVKSLEEECRFLGNQLEEKTKASESWEEKHTKVRKKKIKLEIQNEAIGSQLRIKDMMIEDLETKTEEVIEKLTILEMEAEDVQDSHQAEMHRLKTLSKELDDEIRIMKIRNGREVEKLKGEIEKLQNQNLAVREIDQSPSSPPPREKEEREEQPSTTHKTGPSVPEKLEEAEIEIKEPHGNTHLSIGELVDPPKRKKSTVDYLVSPKNQTKRRQKSNMSQRVISEWSATKMGNSTSPIKKKSHLHLPKSKRKKLHHFPKHNRKLQSPKIEIPANSFTPNLNFNQEDETQDQQRARMLNHYDPSVEEGWNKMKKFSFKRLMKKMDNKLATITKSIFGKNTPGQQNKGPRKRKKTKLIGSKAIKGNFKVGSKSTRDIDFNNYNPKTMREEMMKKKTDVLFRRKPDRVTELVKLDRTKINGKRGKETMVCDDDSEDSESNDNQCSVEGHLNYRQTAPLICVIPTEEG